MTAGTIAPSLRRLTLAVVALLLASCSSSASPQTNPRALPHGEVIQKLEAGKVDSLPTGTVYVRFVRFVSPPGYVINSKQHVPSIVYVETGSQRLTLSGESPIDLVAGQAKFHQSVTHQHLNPGPDPSTWYSIAVWPSSARGQALVDPVARPVFESNDIDRENLPPVPYSEVLREVSLAKGGTSGAHRFGGLSSFYVLDGSISIQIAHRPSLTLVAGNGVTFLPDTDLQEWAPVSEQATYLEYVVTAVGKDFDAPLQQPPAA